MYGKRFDSKGPDDDEVAEYSVAGHIDYARRGRVEYFVTNDRDLLDRKTEIEREAPGLKVCNLEEFLVELDP
jgi:hypothetical protein